LLTTPKQLNESELNESPPVIDNIPVGKNKPNMKDISTVFKNLKQQALFISLNLYEKNSMPRSHVIEIQKMFSILSSALSSAIEYQLNQDDILINSNLECLLNFCKSPFEEIRTEHRMIRTLEELSLFKEPTPYVIEEKVSEVVTQGNPTLDLKVSKIFVMPLRYIFKAIFEIPNLLDLTLCNIKDGLLSNKFLYNE